MWWRSTKVCVRVVDGCSNPLLEIGAIVASLGFGFTILGVLFFLDKGLLVVGNVCWVFLASKTHEKVRISRGSSDWLWVQRNLWIFQKQKYYWDSCLLCRNFLYFHWVGSCWVYIGSCGICEVVRVSHKRKSLFFISFCSFFFQRKMLPSFMEFFESIPFIGDVLSLPGVSSVLLLLSYFSILSEVNSPFVTLVPTPLLIFFFSCSYFCSVFWWIFWFSFFLILSFLFPFWADLKHWLCEVVYDTISFPLSFFLSFLLSFELFLFPLFFFSSK